MLSADTGAATNAFEIFLFRHGFADKKIRDWSLKIFEEKFASGWKKAESESWEEGVVGIATLIQISMQHINHQLMRSSIREFTEKAGNAFGLIIGDLRNAPRRPIANLHYQTELHQFIGQILTAIPEFRPVLLKVVQEMTERIHITTKDWSYRDAVMYRNVLEAIITRWR